MVSLSSLFGYTHPKTTNPNARQPRAAQPTQQAINTTSKDLNDRIDQLTTAFSNEKKVNLPQRTPAEEEAFQRKLKGAAKLYLSRPYSAPQQAKNVIYGREGGINTFEAPGSDSIAQQKQRHFESLAQVIFNDHIKPQLNRALEQKPYCDGATHDHQDGTTNPATGGQSASAPQGTETVDAAGPTSGEQTVQGATAPQAADGETKSETTKPADDKKETNTDKKEEQNWKNGYIGWKAGIGAALLAGGIALKMTVIGIVPGLIMAGVGTALMGWGGINWLSKDK